MKAATEIRTERLLLRKPRANDAHPIFIGYSGDPAVGDYLGWEIHKSLEDTKSFLQYSDNQWQEWPAGPFLILEESTGRIIGSTGLAFVSEDQASTGYVIAKSRWGNGFATEAVAAMCQLARELQLKRLFALCHPNHGGSRRVLEKSGFELEPLKQQCQFPNLKTESTQHAVCYSTTYG